MKVVNNGLTITINGAMGHFPKEFVVSALEKQIPKKPTFKKEDKKRFDNCPNCKTTLIYEDKAKANFYKFNYCFICGQALDWSEEK